MTREIIRLSFDDKKDIELLKEYRKKKCTDTFFETGYGCKNLYGIYDITDGPPTNIYLAIENDEVIGYLEYSYIKIPSSDTLSIWIRVLGTKAHGNREKYKGTGTLLINTITNDAKKEGVDFLILYSSADEFYLRIGFFKIGRYDNIFIKKINSFPTFNWLRKFMSLSVIRYRQNNPKKGDEFKLNLTKERDSMENRLINYGYPKIIRKEAKEEGIDIPISQIYSFPLDEIKESKYYPDSYYSVEDDEGTDEETGEDNVDI